jgi:hypothetical protein
MEREKPEDHGGHAQNIPADHLGKMPRMNDATS